MKAVRALRPSWQGLPAGHADEVHEHQQRHAGTYSLLQQDWHQVGWEVPRSSAFQTSDGIHGSWGIIMAVFQHGSWDSITAGAEGPDGSSTLPCLPDCSFSPCVSTLHRGTKFPSLNDLLPLLSLERETTGVAGGMGGRWGHAQRKPYPIRTLVPPIPLP